LLFKLFYNETTNKIHNKNNDLSNSCIFE